MNKNAPEALMVFEHIENKIKSHRTKLESEATPIEELPLYRAKLSALSILKKELEEKFNAGSRQ